jgi:hypothetical protein
MKNWLWAANLIAKGDYSNSKLMIFRQILKFNGETHLKIATSKPNLASCRILAGKVDGRGADAAGKRIC